MFESYAYDLIKVISKCHGDRSMASEVFQR